MPDDFKVSATVRDGTSERYLTETVARVADERAAVAAYQRRHPRMIELHRVLKISAQPKKASRER